MLDAVQNRNIAPKNLPSIKKPDQGLSREQIIARIAKGILIGFATAFSLAMIPVVYGAVGALTLLGIGFGGGLLHLAACLLIGKCGSKTQSTAQKINAQNPNKVKKDGKTSSPQKVNVPQIASVPTPLVDQHLTPEEEAIEKFRSIRSDTAQVAILLKGCSEDVFKAILGEMTDDEIRHYITESENSKVDCLTSLQLGWLIKFSEKTKLDSIFEVIMVKGLWGKSTLSQFCIDVSKLLRKRSDKTEHSALFSHFVGLVAESTPPGAYNEVFFSTLCLQVKAKDFIDVVTLTAHHVINVACHADREKQWDSCFSVLDSNWISSILSHDCIKEAPLQDKIHLLTYVCSRYGSSKYWGTFVKEELKTPSTAVAVYENIRKNGFMVKIMMSVCTLEGRDAIRKIMDWDELHFLPDYLQKN